MNAVTELIADAIDGVPHPANCRKVMGHDETISKFLELYRNGRIHHAYLVTGPRGIGKASLCLRFASHVFRFEDPQTSPVTLMPVEEGDPIDGMIASRSHPNLLHMARPWDDKAKRFKTQLTVDEVRRTVSFFGTSKGMEGWRVAIVDSADDLNTNAANALLKILEEPPEKTLFFVLSHSPAKVLPTIRSRCLHMPLKPLPEDKILEIMNHLDLLEGVSAADQQFLAGISNGSVRNCIQLIHEDGLELYQNLEKLLGGNDWVNIHALAEKVTGRGQEERYKLLFQFALQFLEARATGRSGDNSSISVLARWAEVWEKTKNSVRTADAYNLDKKQIILNLFDDAYRTAAN